MILALGIFCTAFAFIVIFLLLGMMVIVGIVK